MSRLRVLSAAVLMVATSGALASSFVVTTDNVVDAMNASSHATSNASSSLHDDKVVQAARDDAASFVASGGQIRGARLESAFQHIREMNPQLAATDSELAQAIITL